MGKAPTTKWMNTHVEKFFQNLLGRSPKVKDKHFIKIFNNQLDIKLGHFTQEELDVVLKLLKTRKLPVLMKYHQKYGTQGNSTIYCSDTVTAVYNQNTIRRMDKRLYPPFPHEN